MVRASSRPGKGARKVSRLEPVPQTGKAHHIAVHTDGERIGRDVDRYPAGRHVNKRCLQYHAAWATRQQRSGLSAARGSRLKEIKREDCTEVRNAR